MYLHIFCFVCGSCALFVIFDHRKVLNRFRFGYCIRSLLIQNSNQNNCGSTQRQVLPKGYAVKATRVHIE